VAQPTQGTETSEDQGRHSGESPTDSTSTGTRSFSKLLRYANVTTTMNIYVKTVSARCCKRDEGIGNNVCNCFATREAPKHTETSSFSRMDDWKIETNRSGFGSFAEFSADCHCNRGVTYSEAHTARSTARMERIRTLIVYDPC
jgi:hypothetical protein